MIKKHRDRKEFVQLHPNLQNKDNLVQFVTNISLNFIKDRDYPENFVLIISHFSEIVSFTISSEWLRGYR